MNASLAQKALENFVQCINATGGVIRDRKGYVAPNGDPAWIDLGDAYLLACRAIDKLPVECDEDKLDMHHDVQCPAYRSEGECICSGGDAPVPRRTTE